MAPGPLQFSGTFFFLKREIPALTGPWQCFYKARHYFRTVSEGSVEGLRSDFGFYMELLVHG